MPWRKCAARLCTRRESWEVCAKATIAAPESAKTSNATTRRERIVPFLARSVMIPQPAFCHFSSKGEKPIPPAESKQEGDPEGGYDPVSAFRHYYPGGNSPQSSCAKVFAWLTGLLHFADPKNAAQSAKVACKSFAPPPPPARSQSENH